MNFGLAPDEIIVDSFAGGGGASLGIEWALGRGPDIAINHDREAIALHAANHPSTRHYVENVWKVDPRAAVAEIAARRGHAVRVGLMWLSPDCKHFSKAKGAKPVSKKIRGLAWVAVRWAKAVAPRVICLENVEEFRTWGPVLADSGRPCPDRKGQTYRAFKRALKRLGYVVEDKELRASEYGVPTIRKRLFMVARRDGQPITWPTPEHAPAHYWNFRKVAADCIDWSIVCPSIFDRKKPLAEKTQARIARGVKRFVIDNPKPFIVGVGGRQGQSPERGVDQPYQTICSKADSAVVVPHITKFRTGSSGSGADAPMPTVTANSFIKRPGGAAPLGLVDAQLELAGAVFRCADCGHEYDRGDLPVCGCVKCGSEADPVQVNAPFLATYYGANSEGGARVNDVAEPLRTQGAENRFGLVMPLLTEHANGSNQRNFAADEPLRTQCAQVKGGHFALVAPSIVPTAHAGDLRTHSIEEPLRTITGGRRGDHALVAPSLVPRYGEDPNPSRGGGAGQSPRVRSVEDPLPTVVPTGNGANLVEAYLAKHNCGNEATGQQLVEPVHTVTGKDQKALVTSHLTHFHASNTNGGQGDPEQPMRAITAQGTHIAEVRALLMAYYGNEKDGAQLDEPMRTVTSRDRFALVTVNGVEYVITDIGMRMLVPRELYRAQGFPDTYRIDIEDNGKPLTKTAQVRMVGNSVCPGLAAALILANLGPAQPAVIQEAA